MENSKYSSQIRHIQKYYKKFHIDFKIDMFDRFLEVCEKNNTTPTTEIKKFVEQYISNNS